MIDEEFCYQGEFIDLSKKVKRKLRGYDLWPRTRTYRQVLDNGLTVITRQMPDASENTFHLGVKVGSMHEPEHLQGICHFIEHLFFQSNSYMSWPDFYKFEEKGCNIQGKTDVEFTEYIADAAYDTLDSMIEAYFNAFRNLVYDLEEFEKEKEVILSETRQRIELPSYYLFIQLMEKMIFKDTPMEKIIEGTEESIMNIKEQDVEEFKKEHYVPENTVLVIAGDFDRREVLNTVRKTFGSLEKSGKKNYIRPVKFRQRKLKKIVDWPTLRQPYLGIGYQIPGMLSKDYLKLKFLEYFFSGGTFYSRLQLELREKKGIGYSHRSSMIVHRDIGFFNAEILGFNPKKFITAVKELRGIYMDLATNLVEKKEFKKVKNLTLDALDFVNTLPGDQAAHLFLKEVYGYPYDLKQERAMIKKITREDLLEVAKKYFTDKYVIGVMKPG